MDVKESNRLESFAPPLIFSSFLCRPTSLPSSHYGPILKSSKDFPPLHHLLEWRMTSLKQNLKTKKIVFFFLVSFLFCAAWFTQNLSLIYILADENFTPKPIRISFFCFQFFAPFSHCSQFNFFLHNFKSVLAVYIKKHVTVYCECTCDLVPLLSHPPAFFLFFFISLKFLNLFLLFNRCLSMWSSLIWCCRHSVADRVEKTVIFLSITRDWQSIKWHLMLDIGGQPHLTAFLRKKTNRQTNKQTRFENDLTRWTQRPDVRVFCFFSLFFFVLLFKNSLVFSSWDALRRPPVFLYTSVQWKIAFFIHKSVENHSFSKHLRSGCCSLNKTKQKIAIFLYIKIMLCSFHRNCIPRETRLNITREIQLINDDTF